MRKLDSIGFVFLLVVTIGFAATVGSVVYERTKGQRVIIAGGPAKADSFIILTALKTVVERNYPRISITLLDSAGAPDSMQRLERGEVQLVATSSESAAGSAAKFVVVLFEDYLQLFAHKSSGIEKVNDLKGKKIALRKSGGQYQSFLFLTSHYGLSESDFTFVGQDDEAGDLAFARDEADAIFRVRSPHNSAIIRLARAGNVKFIPVDQASALKIDAPAYQPVSIPLGAYLGSPPTPDANLPTAAIERTLLARADVPDDVIYAITETFMDRRPELAAAIPEADSSVRPLLALMKEPVERTGVVQAAVHPGALSFYHGTRKSILAKHPDLVVAGATLFVAACLWLWQLRVLITWSQKRRAAKYDKRVLLLLEESKLATTERSREPIILEMKNLWNSAVNDLGRQRLTDESFQSFNQVWMTVMNRIAPLEPAPKAPTEPPQPIVREQTKSPWRFSRLLLSRSARI